MKPVNLMASDNQAGFRRDCCILYSVLREMGVPVRFNGYGRMGPLSRIGRLRRRLRRGLDWTTMRRPYSANLFVGWIEPRYLARAARNWMLPNQESIGAQTRELLKRTDWVLCKTHLAIEAFKDVGTRCAYTGFTSLDAFDASVPRTKSFLHVGSVDNLQKGTRDLSATWARHPEWPPLHLVHSSRGSGPRVELATAPNIIHYRRWIPDLELRRLQNECLFHLCPSEAEGWGHTIAEGMACAAVVLTTDAAPMNELVAPDRGILIPYTRMTSVDMGTRYRPDVTALERSIEQMLTMKDAEAERMGQCARDWFLENDTAFRRRFRAFLDERLGAEG